MANGKKKQHMVCSLCKKRVFDKTIIRHMWAEHRAHMMKNHHKPKKKQAVISTSSVAEHKRPSAGAEHKLTDQISYELLGYRLQKQTAEQSINAIERIIARELKG